MDETKSSIWHYTDVDSNLLAHVKCQNGHKEVWGIRHNLFEVLYQSGIDLFINGFYSESVMNFAASLERTYEFFIRITLLRGELTFKNIDAFWKEIKNQSERQYGAFCIQYAKTTNNIWTFDSNQSGFRNKIIHKGHIATSIEVENYATYTTSCQKTILSIIKSDYQNEYEMLIRKQLDHENMLRDKYRKIETDYVIYFPQDLLNLNSTSENDSSFRKALKRRLDYIKASKT